MNVVNPTQPDTPDKGRLQINITSDVTASPVADATVSISYTGVPDSQLEQLTTDSSGQTETIELAAPPLDYSLNPAIEEQPYSEYTLQIEAPGYEPVSIAGAEILPTVTAVQNLTLKPMDSPQPSERIFVIPAHTLYGTCLLYTSLIYGTVRLDLGFTSITYTSSPHTINWILISPMTCKERASFFV